MSGLINSTGSKSGIIGDGIFVQQWKMNSNFSGDSTGVTGWTKEGEDSSSYTMSESSAIWTFPKTGIYEIIFQATCSHNGANAYFETTIRTTVDNFSSQVNHFGYTQQNSSATHYNTSQTSAIFDVQDVSTHKAILRVYQNNDSATTTASGTHVTFKRLRDK